MLGVDRFLCLRVAACGIERQRRDWISAYVLFSSTRVTRYGAATQSSLIPARVASAFVLIKSRDNLRRRLLFVIQESWDRPESRRMRYSPSLQKYWYVSTRVAGPS